MDGALRRRTRLRHHAGQRHATLHVPGKLEWDAKNLRFTNSPEANRFVKPVFRKGAELKL
jgi:hypothetical protein